MTAKSREPENDVPFTLSSGTVVRVRDLVIFQKKDGESSLTIYIQTPTPAGELAALLHEAHELASLHDTFARAKGISRISIAVCRTQECIELRGAAEAIFSFARASDGTWAREPSRAP